MTPFHLATELERRSENALDLPKRTRTRYLIVAATAQEMERVGYEGLTINNIVRRARLARGTFYLYFTNRSDAAAAVMRAYRALIRTRRPRGAGRLGRYDAILQMNRFYVLTYSRNATLLAGVESLVRDRPDQARKRDFWNDRWAKAVLSDAKHRCGHEGTIDDSRALLAIRAVLGMADELLREAYVYRSPAFADYATDEEAVAEVLSIVWYRAVYGAHPEGIDRILPTLNPQENTP
ncbi:MAG: helix-turn-helix domain-containing protein [Silicimonas sp.]